MDSVVAQIKHLMQTADEVGRLNIRKTLQQVQSEFDSTNEVVHSLANLVGWSSMLPFHTRLTLDIELAPVDPPRWRRPEPIRLAVQASGLHECQRPCKVVWCITSATRWDYSTPI